MESVRTEIAEFRRAQSLGYPVAGLTCLTVMALAQGVVLGPYDLAQYADTLSQAQLRALRFRHDRNTGEIRYPKKTTFSRFLHGVDDEAIERVLLRWQERILGPTQDQIVIIDGKKLRHGGLEIVKSSDAIGLIFKGATRLGGNCLESLNCIHSSNQGTDIPAGGELIREGQLFVHNGGKDEILKLATRFVAQGEH